MKTGGRQITNLRFVDDSTICSSKEELLDLLKEASEKTRAPIKHQKDKNDGH